MKNINITFILLSSVVVFFIAIYSFGEAKQTLDEKKKEFSQYQEIAQKYKENHQNYSDDVYIEEKLNKITKDLGIKTSKITQKEKVILFEASNLTAMSFQILFTTLLNENFNITKLEVKTDSIKMEVGVL
jgi:hypothetical protein